jgi:hypothetical protein
MALRLASSGAQLGLVPDRMKAGDQVITHADAPVLLVDPQMSEIVVGGMTVDCRESPDGSVEFVLLKMGQEELRELVREETFPDQAPRYAWTTASATMRSAAGPSLTIRPVSSR